MCQILYVMTSVATQPTFWFCMPCDCLISFQRNAALFNEKYLAAPFQIHLWVFCFSICNSSRRRKCIQVFVYLFMNEWFLLNGDYGEYKFMDENAFCNLWKKGWGYHSVFTRLKFMIWRLSQCKNVTENHRKQQQKWGDFPDLKNSNNKKFALTKHPSNYYEYKNVRL